MNVDVLRGCHVVGVAHHDVGESVPVGVEHRSPDAGDGSRHGGHDDLPGGTGGSPDAVRPDRAQPPERNAAGQVVRWDPVVSGRLEARNDLAACSISAHVDVRAGRALRQLPSKHRPTRRRPRDGAPARSALGAERPLTRLPSLASPVPASPATPGSFDEQPKKMAAMRRRHAESCVTGRIVLVADSPRSTLGLARRRMYARCTIAAVLSACIACDSSGTQVGAVVDAGSPVDGTTAEASDDTENTEAGDDCAGEGGPAALHRLRRGNRPGRRHVSSSVDARRVAWPGLRPDIRVRGGRLWGMRRSRRPSRSRPTA